MLRDSLGHYMKGHSENIGERNPLWKGNDVSYRNLHRWVRRHLGKPFECSYCGESDKRLEWASITHKAFRDLADYIPLCVPCHRKYDKKVRI